MRGKNFILAAHHFSPEAPESEQPALHKSRSTIRDVAKLAGVSIASVSHVMNKTGSTSSETEQKIRSAIEVLNYTPNPHARGLARWRRQDLRHHSSNGTEPELVDRSTGGWVI
jgi:LacI family transcriptional regulator